MPDLYTLVQHSGFGYGGKPGFRRAVELRYVTPVQAKRVVEAGGVVFESWYDADSAEMMSGYPAPEFDTGIYPNVQGKFSTLEIDQLRVYVPCELDWKNYRAEELAIWKTDEQRAREEARRRVRNGTDAITRLKEGAL
jgi:hypothetical protein